MPVVMYFNLRKCCLLEHGAQSRLWQPESAKASTSCLRQPRRHTTQHREGIHNRGKGMLRQILFKARATIHFADEPGTVGFECSSDRRHGRYWVRHVMEAIERGNEIEGRSGR